MAEVLTTAFKVECDREPLSDCEPQGTRKEEVVGQDYYLGLVEDCCLQHYVISYIEDSSYLGIKSYLRLKCLLSNGGERSKYFPCQSQTDDVAIQQLQSFLMAKEFKEWLRKPIAGDAASSTTHANTELALTVSSQELATKKQFPRPPSGSLPGVKKGPWVIFDTDKRGGGTGKANYFKVLCILVSGRRKTKSFRCDERGRQDFEAKAKAEAFIHSPEFLEWLTAADSTGKNASQSTPMRSQKRISTADLDEHTLQHHQFLTESPPQNPGALTSHPYTSDVSTTASNETLYGPSSISQGHMSLDYAFNQQQRQAHLRSHHRLAAIPRSATSSGLQAYRTSHHPNHYESSQPLASSETPRPLFAHPHHPHHTQHHQPHHPGEQHTTLPTSALRTSLSLGLGPSHPLHTAQPKPPSSSTTTAPTPANGGGVGGGGSLPGGAGGAGASLSSGGEEGGGSHGFQGQEQQLHPEVRRLVAQQLQQTSSSSRRHLLPPSNTEPMSHPPTTTAAASLNGGFANPHRKERRQQEQTRQSAPAELTNLLASRRRLRVKGSFGRLDSDLPFSPATACLLTSPPPNIDHEHGTPTWSPQQQVASTDLMELPSEFDLDDASVGVPDLSSDVMINAMYGAPKANGDDSENGLHGVESTKREEEEVRPPIKRARMDVV